jgi:ring-1,2-phenylacetyl-CoA epoxidase subunit PaaD
VVTFPPPSSKRITAEGRGYALRHRAAGNRSRRCGLFAQPQVMPAVRRDRNRRISEFGSTPCKAYRCASCAEPFDYFKCI